MERALSKAARLRVIFLLEDTALYGGVKVVLHQANLLHRRGFRTTVVSKGGSPDWYPLEAPFLQVKSLSPEFFPPADVVIATFWTTIQAAAEVTGAAPLHYCQGFEGGLLHNQEDHPAIRAAYSLPVPAMTVSPSLAEFIEKEFHRPCRVVSPGVENFWKPMWRVSPHQEPRVLVMNPFEFYMKGVPVALEAIRLLRERGVRCRLFRLSQWPLSTAEREIVKPDEFHHNIPPTAVARLLRRSDLLLAPSWEVEGFGLPVLEAMACGVPVVGSDIPSFRYITAGAARLVPFDRPECFADQAQEILTDASRWRAARRRGIEAARAFSEEAVAPQLENAIVWAWEQGKFRRQAAGA